MTAYCTVVFKYSYCISLRISIKVFWTILDLDSDFWCVLLLAKTVNTSSREVVLFSYCTLRDCWLPIFSLTPVASQVASQLHARGRAVFQDDEKKHRYEDVGISNEKVDRRPATECAQGARSQARGCQEG